VMFWNSNGGVIAQPFGGAARIVAPAREGYAQGGKTYASWNGSHYVILTTSLRAIDRRTQVSELAALVEGVTNAIQLGDGVAGGVASAVDKTLVLTIANQTLSGRFVSDDGSVSKPFTLATGVSRAAAAANANEFFAAWITSDGKTHSAQLDENGSMGTITEWPLQHATGIAAAWDGMRFIVRTGDDEPALANHNGITALAARNAGIRANGTLLSLVRQQQLAPIAIRNGTSAAYLVTPDRADKSLMRADLDGRTTKLHEHVGAFAAVDDATIASDGANVFIDRGKQPPFVSPASEQLVAIASNGASSLGVWRSGFAVKGSIGPAEFQLSRAEGQPPVALAASWHGQEFVVVWAEGQPVVFGGWLIKSATVASDGSHSEERVVMTLPIGGNMIGADATRVAWTKGDELHITQLDDLRERVFTASEPIRRVQLAHAQVYWTEGTRTWFAIGEGSPMLIAEDVQDPSFSTKDSGPVAMTYLRFVDGSWRVFVRTMTPIVRRRAV